MEKQKTAVALGLFDGVHLGHLAVISKAVNMKEYGLIPSVFTFFTDTVKHKQGRSVEYIYSAGYKDKLIRSAGIEKILSVEFSQLKDLSGDEFIKRILLDELNAGYVVCGNDFRFGKNASCGFEQLVEFGKKYGFTAEAAEDVTEYGERVSSCSIRNFLKSGNIAKANELLGKNYTVSGNVMDGNHLGRTISFPTINQHFQYGQLVPSYGVYSGTAEINGIRYRTVTNIGTKPTVEGERSPLAETHILGFSGDIYGEYIEVELHSFIRPERKFGSLDELKMQIEADIQKAAL